MSYFSPPTVLLWAVLSVLLQGFLVTHLYRFDRFKCLRWNAGQQPGAFQRVMTYTYLATMPLLVVFSVTMAYIKYREGYVAFPLPMRDDDPTRKMGIDPPIGETTVLVTGPIVPKPFYLWNQSSFDLLRPLYIILAVAWSFEMVTHLEELNFWLFLINQGPRQKPWFKSLEFRTWVVGSICAVVLMPVVAIVAMRKSMLLCEAWVFFVGSLCSMAITVMFLYVLWRFPGFLQRIRSEGAPPVVVLRLTGFHEINITRVGFRFLFTIPLFLLAVDGIRSSERHPILSSRISGDLLGALGGIGCMVSSTLTLLVFFPRSRTQEAGYNPRKASTTMHRSQLSFSKPPSRRSSFRSVISKDGSRLTLDAPASPAPVYERDDDAFARSPVTERGHTHHLQFRTEPSTPVGRTFDEQLPGFDDFRDAPAGEEVQMQDMGPGRRRRVRPRSMPTASTLHPFITSYASPINFHDLSEASTSSREPDYDA